MASVFAELIDGKVPAVNTRATEKKFRDIFCVFFILYRIHAENLASYRRKAVSRAFFFVPWGRTPAPAVYCLGYLIEPDCTKFQIIEIISFFLLFFDPRWGHFVAAHFTLSSNLCA